MMLNFSDFLIALSILFLNILSVEISLCILQSEALRRQSRHLSEIFLPQKIIFFKERSNLMIYINKELLLLKTFFR